MVKARELRAAMIFIVIAALLVIIFSYESYRRSEYESWRESFRRTALPSAGLTVASDNEILMWEYRPGSRYTMGRTGAVSQFDEHGFRQMDSTPPSEAAATTRVAFIGDSLTVGFEVDADKTFVHVYESRSNRARPDARVEALNFGIDGYNTTQIAELLKTRVLDFSPDRVIYVMCLNDFDFYGASGEKIRYFRPPRSFLLEELRRVYDDLSARSDDYHQRHFDRNKRRVFRDIARMGSLLASREIDFAVAIVPVFRGFGRWQDYPYKEMHDEIVEQLSAQNLRVLDLLPSFRVQNGDPADDALDVWHMAERGHRLIGVELADRIVD